MGQVTKGNVAAFLLGVLFVLGVQRWLYLEASVANLERHVSFIEGFLEQATSGGLSGVAPNPSLNAKEIR